MLSRADYLVERALQDVTRLVKRRSQLGDAADGEEALRRQARAAGEGGTGAGVAQDPSRGGGGAGRLSEEERARRDGISAVDPLLETHGAVRYPCQRLWVMLMQRSLMTTCRVCAQLLELAAGEVVDALARSADADARALRAAVEALDLARDAARLRYGHRHTHTWG